MKTALTVLSLAVLSLNASSAFAQNWSCSGKAKWEKSNHNITVIVAGMGANLLSGSLSETAGKGALSLTLMSGVPVEQLTGIPESLTEAYASADESFKLNVTKKHVNIARGTATGSFKFTVGKGRAARFVTAEAKGLSCGILMTAN